MASSTSKNALAALAWRRLFELFMRTRGERDRVLARRSLTPNDAKALASLRAREGRPMIALAREWGTDASNATWVVDRLERQGLAERRADPSDRRVKLVVLTPRGKRVHNAVLAAFHKPPRELERLDARELALLVRLLEKTSAE